MNSEDKPLAANAGFRFSLRALTILVLIVGSFMGGWVANEARHRYIIKDDAKIEVIEGTQSMVIRGKKEDVEALGKTLSKSIGLKSKQK